MGDGPMSTENTLRFSGRAGSKGDIGRVVRIHLNTCLTFRIMTQEISDALFCAREFDATGNSKTIKEFRKFRGQIASGIHLHPSFWPRNPKVIDQACGRISRIENDEGRAGFENTE